MDFSTRSYKSELLDANDIPFEDIKKNMQELEFINRYLGGHAISVKGLSKLLLKHITANEKFIHICEIGSGGGDNLKALANWCKQKNIAASFTGIDINTNCVAFAKQQHPEFNFICSDYKNFLFTDKPDIIFSSLFCHHFNNEVLVSQLTWMNENSRIGFFINDLHRHKVAYYSIKWLTAFFSSSYLVKNDAPLSVQRGFVKTDWYNIFREANIFTFTVEWKWAFRWLIISKKKIIE